MVLAVGTEVFYFKIEQDNFLAQGWDCYILFSGMWNSSALHRLTKQVVKGFVVNWICR